MSTDPDVTEAERQEIEAREAFAVEQNIKQAMEDGRQALWRLAENLYAFDEMHGWLKLGYETKSAWLADNEITLTRPSYERYVGVWRKLVVERKIEPTRLRELEQAKVAIVTPVIVKNEALVDEVLDDVKALGARDLREKYFGKKEVITTVDTNPATSPAEDSGQVLADTAEPVRADAWDAVEEMAAEVGAEVDDGVVTVAVEEASTELVTTTATVDGEVIVGEIVDAEIVSHAGYDFPGFVTRGNVEAMLNDLKFGIDSGATYPRLGRPHCQVALELAKAYLATH